MAKSLLIEQKGKKAPVSAVEVSAVKGKKKNKKNRSLSKGINTSRVEESSITLSQAKVLHLQQVRQAATTDSTTTTMTTLIEKKKVAKQLPSGEEESGTTFSEPKSLHLKQRLEEGMTEESPELFALQKIVEKQQSKKTPVIVEDHWLTNYTILSLFFQDNGHSSVLRSDRNKKLSGWVKRQRNNRREGKLNQDKIDLLDRLNFCWHRLDHAWDTKYNMLVEFYKKYGHCEVPTGTNRPLAEWTQRQRREYRNRHEFIEKHHGAIDPDNHRKPDHRKQMEVAEYNENLKGGEDPKKGTMMTSDRVEALEKVDGWSWTISLKNNKRGESIIREERERLKSKPRGKNDNNITL